MKHAPTSPECLLPLACLLFAAPIAGCDVDDSAHPRSSRNEWIALHLEHVAEADHAEQAAYFDEHRDELDFALQQPARQSYDPELDFTLEDEPSALQDVTCDLSATGCVNWNAEQGCTVMLICVVCTDGHWACLNAPIS